MLGPFALPRKEYPTVDFTLLGEGEDFVAGIADKPSPPKMAIVLASSII